MKVYISQNKDGRDSKVYHTNEECPSAKQAERMITKDLDKLNGHFRECHVCSGELINRQEHTGPNPPEHIQEIIKELQS